MNRFIAWGCLSFSSLLCLPIIAETKYWDKYSDIKPGIKSVIIDDRGVQVEISNYDRKGRIISHAECYLAMDSDAKNDVWKSGGSTIYLYDVYGRLSKMESTEMYIPQCVLIEYGNHGRYIPFRLESGEYTGLLETRLIRDITKITCMYSNGVTETHTFKPDGKNIQHSFLKVTPGARDKKELQLIYYYDNGLPEYFDIPDGHVGPVSYWEDGSFDSIPEIRHSGRNTLVSSFTKYTPTYNVDKITLKIGDEIYIHNYKYDEKDNLIEDSSGKYFYEYDSFGNWTKKNCKNNEATSVNDANCITTRSIHYY